MSLIKMLTELFDSIFRSSSPEVQKKSKLKKIENELRGLSNGIYRDGLIQPNFAEILRVLYINTRPIAKILESTIDSNDIKRNTRFEFQLIVSCYSEEDQQILKSLEYESRKQEVIDAEQENTSTTRIFDDQHRRLEKIIHELNSKEFIAMDTVFVKLKQLIELCHFNFITPLKAFDAKYDPNNPTSQPTFVALPPVTLENVFQDLYYIIADFQMTMPVANAIIALAQIIDINSMNAENQKKILGNLKKIEGACHKILTPELLTSLICLAKQNPDFVPSKESFSADTRQRFSTQIQEQYQSDESRIKREIKDANIKTQLETLFEEKSLETLFGYNDELNNLLLENSSVALSWLTPLKILKSFVDYFYTESIKSFLDDVVIEGFFNNPDYKSQFSQTVFSANEVSAKIQEFEDSFKKDERNDVKIIQSYILDSHKDPDFSKKLVSQINQVNAEAKTLIQSQVTALYTLYQEIGDLLQDAKKASSEIIQNLKVLMMSSRNRDSTYFLENTYEKWKVFFDIMRNYAIITTVEKK